MKKRLFIALFLCLVIVLSLTSFTACNKNDGTLMGYMNEKDFNKTLDAFLGLVIDQQTNGGRAKLSGEFFIPHKENISANTQSNSTSTVYIGDGCVGFLEIRYLRSDRWGGLYTLIYSSKEQASSAMSALNSDMYIRLEQSNTINLSDWNYRQKNNLIILEQEDISYEDVMKHSIPKSHQNDEMPTFFKNSLVKEMKSNNRCVKFEMRNDSLPNRMYIYVSPSIGNCRKEYKVSPYYEQLTAYLEKQEILCNSHETTTDDSYLEYKMIGEQKYYAYYMQPRAMVHSEEKEDGTIKITDIYYDGNVLEIPSTIDGKVVSELTFYISMDDIPAFGTPSVAEIHFMGTIAQWNAISKDETYGRRTIHCTDGDIAPTAE